MHTPICKSALVDPGCYTSGLPRGLYKPTTTADRSIAFNVPPHARVYGGFAGTETLFAQRDVAAYSNRAVGDIDNNDNNGQCRRQQQFSRRRDRTHDRSGAR